MQTHFIKKLLNLTDVEVKNIKNLKDSVQIFVEMPKTTQFCPRCAFETSKVHDYYNQPIKDIPIQFKPTTIFYHKRRYECSVCGKKFYEKNKLVGKYSRKTNRFVSYIDRKLTKILPLHILEKHILLLIIFTLLDMLVRLLMILEFKFKKIFLKRNVNILNTLENCFFLDNVN